MQINSGNITNTLNTLPPSPFGSSLPHPSFPFRNRNSEFLDEDTDQQNNN